MANDTVLIVGAGPTGMTAAIELKRLGMDVRIIDKSDHHGAVFAGTGGAGANAGTIPEIRDCGGGNCTRDASCTERSSTAKES